MAGLLSEVYEPYLDRFAPTALRENATTIAAAWQRWLVAEVDGSIVGCVRHEPEGDDHTFCFLAVSPSFRRQGIGSLLVEEVVAEARRNGAEQILIALRLSLTENISFFGKRGFSYREPFGTGRHGLFVRGMESGNERRGGAGLPARAR